MRTYHYDHIHLRSPNPDVTARFFRDDVQCRGDAQRLSAGYAVPGSDARHNECRRPESAIAPSHPHDPTAASPEFPYYGLEHIGLTVDDVDAACDELRAKGADVVIGPLTRDPGTRLAFMRGPEGIMVELVQLR
jgi:catechol 2,3-dioxygenase-like lactoylglutathione lyase family enzyme